jgi:hypothetical protein
LRPSCPPQLVASALLGTLAVRCPGAVPAATVVRMAERILDDRVQGTALGEPDLGRMATCFNAMYALQADGVHQRLETDSAVELGIRMMQYYGEAPVRDWRAALRAGGRAGLRAACGACLRPHVGHGACLRPHVGHTWCLPVALRLSWCMLVKTW